MDDNTARLIESVATKLGTTADHLWTVQVSWIHTQAISDWIMFGALCPLGILAWIAVIRAGLYAYRNESEGLGMIILCVSIALLCTSPALVILLNEAICYSLNPEGAALSQIIRAVTK